MDLQIYIFINILDIINLILSKLLSQKKNRNIIYLYLLLTLSIIKKIN